MDQCSQEIIKDHTKVMVRKRTKRRSRPSATTSTSSTSCCDNISSVENSEEDEDMARCLILLAQGGTPKTDVESLGNSQNMGAMTEWRPDLFVYECKTCNRSFPSFQALGGHRASHKKPKTEEKQVIHYDQDEENVRMNKMITASRQPICVMNSKAKVHECSICGSEFASGQALGGHMRRHRSNPITNSTSNINTGCTSDEKARDVFQLDLNLPAPEDNHRIRFLYSGSLAPPPLVGCHY